MAYILKNKKFDIAPIVKFSLPAESQPLQFIHQGTGNFLWYLDSGATENWEFVFRFIGKGDVVDFPADFFGSIKDGSYKFVFRELT